MEDKADKNSSQNQLSQKPFSIVAIGASAGGLEAIHEFFDNMADTDQLCFVVIQHLSPDYKSLLVDLVAKHTYMSVVEATHNTLLEPGKVYVIPPGKLISLKGQNLQLEDKPKHKIASNVIDTFLVSLAKEAGPKAIAVILSGTGSDGTHGCQAVKQHGGFVLVQDPITARFDGMPNSAISAGNLDYILSPELMPIQIFEFLHEEVPFSLWDNNKNNEQIIEEIFRLLYKHTGCDFQFYKKPTILRRIAKRMSHYNVQSLEEYLTILRHDVPENKVLCKEFLIGVTKFFRDKPAYDVISKTVLPQWHQEAKPDQPFKVWVTACSSGNEAYSLAMVIHDYFEAHGLQNPIKIFATDIDQAAIEIASRGIYTDAVENEVPTEYLTKYFIREGDQYVIKHDIRKLIVFARHNIISDPPFIKNDLVCCRNMLIYMDIKLQRKILSTLYFSINPGGFLWLGPSETASMLMENLEELDRKWKIYQKAIDGKKNLSLYNPFYSLSPTPPGITVNVKERNTLKNYESFYHHAISDDFKFAGVFVDKNYMVKEAIGQYVRYLSLPDKGIQLNITKMVIQELSVSLNSALRKCMKEKEKVEIPNIRLRKNDKNSSINITVFPQSVETYGYLFVLFSENKLIDYLERLEPADMSTLNSQQANNYIQELKAELHETEANLQKAVENLESANQELQSSNEEMMAANEELQSSNEELQSLNEELHTLNTEHQQKIQELVTLNDDLNNYLKNSEIGQIFVDEQLRIRKFNPMSTRMINLIESDIGRPLAHISHNVKDVNISDKIEKTVTADESFEREVELKNGTTCLMRIRPYVKQDGTKDGVVLSFVDISAIKELNSLVAATFNSSINPILAMKAIRDHQGSIVDLEVSMFNNAARFFFNSHRNGSPARASNALPFLEKYGLKSSFFSVVETGKGFKSETYLEEFKCWFDISAVKMWEGLIVTFNDITKLKQVESELKTYLRKLERIRTDLEQSNHDLQQFASVASHDLKEPLRKIQMIIDLLKDSAPLKALKEEDRYLQIIYRAADRMRLLIDDLLSFSKLSTEGKFVPVDVNRLIEDCLSDLEVAINEKNAKVVADRFPPIEGIPQRLRQLIQNLISNALKFARADVDPRIKIQCERIDSLTFDASQDPSGSVCKISVCDNGIGLDEQYAEVVFNMFWKLSNERSGTGIGLAICKKIAEQHSGRIRVVRNETGGSTFEILLPLHQTRDNQPVDVAQVKAPAR